MKMAVKMNVSGTDNDDSNNTDNENRIDNLNW